MSVKCSQFEKRIFLSSGQATILFIFGPFRLIWIDPKDTFCRSIISLQSRPIKHELNCYTQDYQLVICNELDLPAWILAHQGEGSQNSFQVPIWRFHDCTHLLQHWSTESQAEPSTFHSVDRSDSCNPHSSILLHLLKSKPTLGSNF